MRKRAAYFVRPFRLCQIRNPPTSTTATQVRGSETGVISPFKPLSPRVALSRNMEGGSEETKEPKPWPAKTPSSRNVPPGFNVMAPGSVPSLDSWCSRDPSDFSSPSPTRRENDVWARAAAIEPNAQLKNIVKPTKERLLALHIFSSAEMFRILEMQQRQCYTWMRRPRIFRLGDYEARTLLAWTRRPKLLCGLPSRRSLRRCGKVKEVRLRPDYGATAFVLCYAASEDWNASTNDQDRLA
jgi:hypothetical protein